MQQTTRSHRRKAAGAEARARLRIEAADDTHLVGSTVGRVETWSGQFLFPPVDVDRSVQRVFIPKDAYREVSFGTTALGEAAAAWITTPQDVLAAIGRQQTAPVLRVGVAIANLGLAPPPDRACTRRPGADAGQAIRWNPGRQRGRHPGVGRGR